MLQELSRNSIILMAAAGLITACVGVGVPGTRAQTGDYGDAPDGGATGYPGPFAQTGAFPTLSTSGGAVTLNTDQARFGPGASAEADANDPADPDGQPNLNPSNTDRDDGLVDFVLVLVSIPPPAALTVNLTAPPGSGGGNFFVNAIIDMNLDGAWGGVTSPGVPEWVVKNFPVQLTAGQSTPVALPPFLFGFGNRLPDGAWLRLLVSREAVAATDWDGGGQFSAGEVEDHVIQLPVFGPTQKRIVMNMNCPRRVLFPPGRAQVRFRCQAFNIALGATAGSFSYVLNGIGANAPSVTVNPLGAPANLGCAGGPPFPAGGPVRCGNPPGDIPIAGAGPVNLFFVATDNGGPLPSNWVATASAEDPPSVVTPDGITVGFGDSFRNVTFDRVEIKIKAKIKLYKNYVLIELTPKVIGTTRPEDPISVIVRPGESWHGLSYSEMRKMGDQMIDLPPLQSK